MYFQLQYSSNDESDQFDLSFVFAVGGPGEGAAALRLLPTLWLPPMLFSIIVIITLGKTFFR